MICLTVYAVVGSRRNRRIPQSSRVTFCPYFSERLTNKFYQGSRVSRGFRLKDRYSHVPQLFFFMRVVGDYLVEGGFGQSRGNFDPEEGIEFIRLQSKMKSRNTPFKIGWGSFLICGRERELGFGAEV